MSDAWGGSSGIKSSAQRVPMNLIRADPENLTMAQENIRKGMGAVTTGPVVLYRRKGQRGYELGDGHHRFAEALISGASHIQAMVSPDILPPHEKGEWHPYGNPNANGNRSAMRAKVLKGG